MTNEQFQRIFLMALLIINLGVAFFIFRPFFAPLFVAITFAVIFHPLYRLIVRGLGGWESTAALITTLLVLIIVVTPLLFFGWQIFQEARFLYVHANDASATITSLIDSVNNTTKEAYLPQISDNIQQYLRQVAGWLFQNLGNAFSGIAQFLLSLFLSLLTLYYALKDGPRLIKHLISYSPLLDRHDKKIVRRLQTAVRSVFFGALVIALLQGLLAGIGFKLFGVPNPALWGSLAVVAALIPNIGTALVMVPALAYLFLSGEMVLLIGLLIWSVVVVGTIDNLLRPKLIERGLRIHPLLILLAVLGGIIVFGPVGFLFGPLVLSLFFALLDIYPLIFGFTKKATD